MALARDEGWQQGQDGDGGEEAGAALPVRPAAAGRAGQRHQDLGEVARGGMLNLAGAGLAAFATVGVTVVVTRHFSPAIAGAFFTATSLFLILESVSGLSAYNGAVYFIARLRSLGEERRIGALLRAALIPVAIASALVAAAVLAAAGPLAHALLGGHLSRHGATPGALAGALRALAVALPFAALTDTFLGASRGYRNMLPTVAVDRIGRNLLQLAGVLVAAAMGSAALLAPLWAVGYIPAAAVAGLWLVQIRHSPGKHASPRPRRGRGRPAGQAARPAAALAKAGLANANPRGFWRFTAPRALATLAQIIIQRLDIVLVGIYLGPAAAAVYTAATRFLVAGQFGNAAISMAAQPRFTELFAIGDKRGANAVYQATTGWLVCLTWPIYLLALVFSGQVLAIFGHSYRAGTTVMAILGIAMLVATACGQVDMVLTTTGRSSWSLGNGLLAVCVNVAVNLVLIPRYGITGAAISWAAAIAITNLLPLAQVAKVVRVHPFGRAFVIAALLSVVSFCLLPLGMRAALGASAAVAVGAGAAGAVVMLAGMWWFSEALQLSVMPGFSFLIRRLPVPARGTPE
ncbi:MAG TPA: polysaccharide biosynthesis C-terminal domain-containing protein [Streptosporangiaceae bacterium]|jgi:O-antigen/teichoic acid export membrane protein